MGALAIDCGTSTTGAAIKVGSEILMGSAIDGTELIPSYVSYTPAQRMLLGKPARARRMIDPKNSLHGAKRIVGQALSSSTAKKFAEQYPFDLAEGTGGIGFETYAGFISAQNVVTQLLKHVSSFPQLEDVDKSRCLLTMPATFTKPQQDALRAAAKDADLGQAQLLAEPTAAAYAFLGESIQPGLVMVYDLGGGTFDTALLEWNASGPKLLATAGDPYLGGEEIDYRLAKDLAQSILEEHRWDIRSSPEAYERLVAMCEKAKHQLCTLDETWINLGIIDQPLQGKKISIHRRDVERISLLLAQRSFLACDELLAKAGVRREQVSSLIMAGGSTRIPAIVEAVQKYFAVEAHKGVDPEKAVVVGAARYADSHRSML